MTSSLKTRRGTSVLLVLLLIPVLVFLARAVHWLSTTSGHRSQTHRRAVTAQFLAEAGQAHALAKLKSNANWEDGFDRVEMDNVRGHYSVVFNPEGDAYEEGESVNNITGSFPVDGPRGENTVQPGHVELIVHADSDGLLANTSAVYVAKSKKLGAFGLGASGNIVLQGRVEVRGIENLVSQKATEAGIHSNSADAGPVIRWRKNSASDRMNVQGKVTAISTDANAIQLEGVEGVDYQAQEIANSAAPLTPPDVDIPGTVSNNSSLAAPTFNDFGTTQLAAGRSYVNGDVTLQGDLELDGHALFVNGNLTVNGTISGEGSVYVTGGTKLKGDTHINSQETGVALFSHGAVELQGFNGKEFLNRLSQSDPNVAQAMADFDRGVTPVVMRRQKGGDKKIGEYYDDARGNSIPVLVGALDRAGADGETARFVKRQLRRFGGGTGEEGAVRTLPPGSQHITTWGSSPVAYRPTTNIRGRLIRGPLPELKLSKLGQAYFQGLIVTDSYVLTDNQVSVVGSLWSTGKSSDPPVDLDGESIKPGDIVVKNGTTIILNEELLEKPEATTRDVEELELKVWVK